MTPEHQSSNIASWEAIAAHIEQYPNNAHWALWKPLVRRFLCAGVAAGLHRYFRAGQSMHHILFSTLDHHGLRDEPRVTIEFHPPSELRLAYGTTNLWFGAPELEYSLPFDAAFATFRRFLHQLWTATVPEPIPEDIRSPNAPLAAPVLTNPTKVA
jgi:hypothetical protein